MEGTIELSPTDTYWETPGVLPPGTDVRVRIRARNAAGIGPWSMYTARVAVWIPSLNRSELCCLRESRVKVCSLLGMNIFLNLAEWQVALATAPTLVSAHSAGGVAPYLLLVWSFPADTGAGSSDPSLVDFLTIEVSTSAEFETNVNSVVVQPSSEEAQTVPAHSFLKPFQHFLQF